MNLTLVRYSDTEDDTLGALYVDGRFQCYTLEDEHRNKKVYGETRIPASVYQVKFRTVGGFHQRYSKRFPKLHKGMLELQDVRNFDYVLIHIGNDDDDTAGCILVGNTANNNQIDRAFVGHSTAAYRRLYTTVSEVLEAGEEVTLTIYDRP